MIIRLDLIRLIASQGIEFIYLFLMTNVSIIIVMLVLLEMMQMCIHACSLGEQINKFHKCIHNLVIEIVVSPLFNLLIEKIGIPNQHNKFKWNHILINSLKIKKKTRYITRALHGFDNFLFY